jgi:hypothetical protein
VGLWTREICEEDDLPNTPDVPPDAVLWVEATILSQAPCEIQPEHPTWKLVTDNLDNFSNRGDRHRLSIPSTPQDKASPTLSGAPTLPCRGYRGYRSYRLPKPTKEESHESRF